jgi:hypothetical protein
MAEVLLIVTLPLSVTQIGEGKKQLKAAQGLIKMGEVLPV